MAPAIASGSGSVGVPSTPRTAPPIARAAVDASPQGITITWKHAFPPGGFGSFSIDLSPSPEALGLRVVDARIGLPFDSSHLS